MKTLFSLFLLFSGSVSIACSFSTGHKSIYSLSGPVTVILEELGVLNSPTVKGISVFYPAPGSYKGEIIPGGVFLSPLKLSSMKNSIVFYDGSQELKKLFRSQNIEAVEFTSRNQTPREVTASALSLLKNHLTGCEEGKILKKLSDLENEIQKRMSKKMSVVFFLGRITSRKFPELVIANDGLVLWLRKMNLITTYPSELAYVNWSGAIMDKLKSGSTFVGITEAAIPSVQGTGERYNLVYPGGLIPGIRQLEAWNYFLSHVSR